MIRALGVDPGAERMGWGSVGLEDDGSLFYHWSGILLYPRDSSQPFQEYRMDLTQDLAYYIPTILDFTTPDVIYSETIPAVGGGNFAVATQSYLANVAVTVLHVCAAEREIPVHQIGATTVKKTIAGSGKASKVKVRNGVIERLPELAVKKKSWAKVFDESDALAVGITGLENYGKN